MTDKKKKNLIIQVSEEEHRQIKHLAVDTGKTIKGLMLECLQRLIREYEDAKKK
ncbi:MAG: hypothetical protein K9K64_16860 [Desulfohalobiaceae bacterium]|nr:hypothetical protein [Desulfohalobiaceae bacterium]